MIGLVFGIKQIRKHPQGRYYFDKMLLQVPVIGSLLRKIAVGRFTRTLGTLITSGVPILEGLAITAKTSGNAVLEEALMKVRRPSKKAEPSSIRSANAECFPTW